MNRFNLSQGLAAAGQALQQGVQVHANMDLEAMRDARAENLARLQFGWKAQHDVNIQDRQMAHDERLDKSRGEQETQREGFQQGQQERANSAQWDRMLKAQEASEGRMRTEQTGRETVENSRLMAQNRLAMQQNVERIDSERRQLATQIAVQTRLNYSLSAIQDPDKRRIAQARDPTIGPLIQQLAELDKSRSNTIGSFTLYGASLGDPNFKGKQTSELPSQPGAGSSQPQPPNSSTPDNPLDPTLPGSHVDPTADNAPAVDPQQTTMNQPPPGSPPGSSAAGMPPVYGVQRPPTQSLVGPLIRQRSNFPSLIPGSFGGDQGTAQGFGQPPMPSPFQSQSQSLIPNAGS